MKERPLVSSFTLAATGVLAAVEVIPLAPVSRRTDVAILFAGGALLGGTPVILRQYDSAPRRLAHFCPQDNPLCQVTQEWPIIVEIRSNAPQRISVRFECYIVPEVT